ncbi:hypothetical protein LINGRAHAP2_LOCUS19852 [Linum grandiflorum]
MSLGTGGLICYNTKWRWQPKKCIFRRINSTLRH